MLFVPQRRAKTTILAPTASVTPSTVATTKTTVPVNAENMIGPAETSFWVAPTNSFACVTLIPKAPHSVGPQGPARVFRPALPARNVRVTCDALRRAVLTVKVYASSRVEKTSTLSRSVVPVRQRLEFKAVLPFLTFKNNLPQNYEM